MKIFILITAILCSVVQADEICLDKEDLRLFVLKKEIEAENRGAVLHAIEKIDLIRSFTNDLKGKGTSNQYKRFDQLIRIYLSSIVIAIDVATNNGTQPEIYENRLSKDVLEYIAENSNLYPDTMNSAEYQRLVYEVAKPKNMP